MGRLASTPLTGSADSVYLSPLPPASPAFPSSPWTEVMTIMDGSYLSAEQKLSVIHTAAVLRDLVHSFITAVGFCFCLVTDFCCSVPACVFVAACHCMYCLLVCCRGLVWFGFVYFSCFVLFCFFVGQLTGFLPWFFFVLSSFISVTFPLTHHPSHYTSSEAQQINCTLCPYFQTKHEHCYCTKYSEIH